MSLWCLLSPPIGCIIYGTNWMVLWCGLKLDCGYVCSGTSWEGSTAGQAQLFPMSFLSPPCRSYEVICGG